MKKFVMILAALLLVQAIGCGKKQPSSVPLGMQSDCKYVQSKGVMIVGVTEFAPLDYEEAGKWTGFDAEMAEAFAESLGVEVELVKIDWDKKTALLNSGEIDCIWNGMTRTQELEKEISCSEPYLFNSQVVVMDKKNLEKYSKIEQMQNLLFAAEEGSAGEKLLKEKKYRYTAYETQKDAVQNVSSSKADAAVVDQIMAAGCTGDGHEFENLSFEISLNEEVLCVGFRMGSDLTDKVNEFFKTVKQDGTMDSLAKKYGIEKALMDAE